MERALDGWRDNVGTPSPLLDEMVEMSRVLTKLPDLGAPYAIVRGVLVLLRSSQRHVYYRVVGDVVQILSVWSTSRAHGPRFGPR